MSSIKMVKFCTLMVGISLCDGVEVTKREKMEFRFEEECRYLSNDNQNPRPNAFYIPEKGFSCCMCSEGHNYTGNCDDGRPQNTHCEICPDGTDITHEPHVEEVCQPITCSGGKVYDSGLKKCRCPLGKIETRNGKFCKKKRTQPKQKQADVISTSEQTTNGKTFTTKTPTGRADVNPMTHPGSLVISSPGQITDGKTLTEKPSTETSTIFTRLISNHSSTNSRVKSSTTVNGLSNTMRTEDTGNRKVLVYIAVPVAIIIIISVAVGIPIHRYKKSTEDVESMTSSCLLKFKRKDENDQKFALNESSEGLLSNKQEKNTPQLRKNGRQTPDNSRYEYESCYRNAVEEPQLNIHEYPVPPNESVPVESSSSHNDTYWEQRAALIPKSKHKKFAQEVAKRLGGIIPKEEAKTLFRIIINNCPPNTLRDIERKEQSTENYVRECMDCAIASEGEALTPFYLWTEIKQRPFNEHLEIVEGAINDFIKSKRK